MRKFTIGLLAAAFTLFGTPIASAHGQILASYPESYSNTTPIPTQVWIQFDGNLQSIEGETINSIEVIDSTGLAVNYGDPVIEGGKISTKISGQSAPGVFTVNYRIVSEDGHPVEDSYTFNASPNYAVTTEVIEEPQERNQLTRGGVVLGIFLIVFLVGYIIKLKNEKKK